MLIFMQGQYI